jgi:hypothetical protein
MNLNLFQFLQDGDGDFSSMRLVVLLWCTGILAMWMFVCIAKVDLQALPESVVAALGILITGKAVQKKIEQPKQELCEPKKE